MRLAARARLYAGAAAGDAVGVELLVRLPIGTLVGAATGGHATADDQSVTSDGRVLDTKEKVLAFLAELDEARQQNAAVGSP